jgi:hypothetical protein
VSLYPVDQVAHGTVVVAERPTVCAALVEGKTCGAPAAWLMCHTSCTAVTPYCHAHAVQLSEGVDAGEVRPACGYCRRAIVPTWLPL